ncbi:MAG: hypothetical protein IT427_13910 [Pirellulales bacterium]|nr:hypothetical protein [Pirellulales bacterium]
MIQIPPLVTFKRRVSSKLASYSPAPFVGGQIPQTSLGQQFLPGKVGTASSARRQPTIQPLFGLV